MENILVPNVKQAIEAVKEEILNQLEFNIVSITERYGSFGDEEFEIIYEVNEGFFSDNREKISSIFHVEGLGSLIENEQQALVQEAIEKAKQHVFNWLEFNIVSINKKYDYFGDEEFEIIYEVNEGFSSHNRVKFSATVAMHEGSISLIEKHTIF